jgi:hypothetical protein
MKCKKKETAWIIKDNNGEGGTYYKTTDNEQNYYLLYTRLY